MPDIFLISLLSNQSPPPTWLLNLTLVKESTACRIHNTTPNPNTSAYKFIVSSPSLSHPILLFSLFYIRLGLFSFSKTTMAASDVEFRCFVGGLAWATDDQSLERAFSQYGEVTESKVRLDQEI